MMDHAAGMEDMAGMESPAQSKRPISEANTPEDNGETITIPSAFLEGTRFKAGDELVLKVVSTSPEGIEVAYAKGEPEGEESGRSKANSELDELDKQDSDY